MGDPFSAPPTKAETAQEALEQVRSLETLCDSFFAKRAIHLSRQMSSTLRTLLLGSSGQQSLVVKCLSDPCLCPLRFTLPANLEAGQIFLQGTLIGRFFRHWNGDSPGCSIIRGRFGPNARLIADRARISLHEIFDPLAQPILLGRWLEQPFLRKNQTLQTFIKLMANKAGGAHFDPTADTRRFNNLGCIHQHLVAKIADSVWPQLARQITAVYPQA
jgi:hypothetical protein